MARTKDEMKGVHHPVIGNGQFLPFRDQSFDLVVSNSVIEHVGDRSSQERFAKEIARVGRNYWVQTPNSWFPIEQHLLTPFIHWLPRSWQNHVVRRFTIWSLISGATSDQRNFYIDHYPGDVRLLSASDLASLFPPATIVREYVFGWAKSFIALKNEWVPAPRPTVLLLPARFFLPGTLARRAAVDNRQAFAIIYQLVN